MPTIKQQTNIETDFTVYCETCGHGLCDITKVKREDEIHVEVCPSCIREIKEEKEKEIKELEDRLEIKQEVIDLLSGKGE